MVRERASRQSVSLSLEVDPSVGLVEADERKVKQVIFNLLSNAVKFTPDRGRVDVIARQVGGEVWVVVRDTGIGIAPDDQASIFEEFRQAGRLSTSSREGTGLGLALARKFVELHGGRLWVESRVGVGSTFTFTLPAAPASTGLELVQGDGLRQNTARAGEPDRTVLVVEDNSHAADLLRLYLEGGGFAVTPVRDGETALRLARGLKPAAIILDILLPGLDGWDVLALAKADPAIAHIPIVVVSMLDERGKGSALGAADYLVKPVQRDTLLTTLRRVMPLKKTG
jgi:CheY-like chemotaxis protein/anti-sigma regulatory factor (Ser/Thr protein kinase)